MQKTVVLNIVGLSTKFIGINTPFLKEWTEKGKSAAIIPVLPAVTCSAQSTYLTGKLPAEHGIVGNGWYFEEEAEVKFWRQSNHLVKSPKIWDKAKAQNPDFTCANLFWWYNMYSTVDYSVTPRPQYLADGRKLPDCYSHPADLRDILQKKLGTFPLFQFWGPGTSIRSSEWIAESAKITEELYHPTLTLVYLPHLDYNFQRYGQDHPSIPKDLQAIDAICKDLINYYEKKGANVIVLSEYSITDVERPIHLNRVLRDAGYLALRIERGTELLDVGASKAFAVADHQIAHIYVNHKSLIPKVKHLIEGVQGVEQVLDEDGKKQQGLLHSRAGDLVAIADKDSWFTYYFWIDDHKAPDYARMVDIHKKPGYDPVEMFLNPKIKFPMWTIGRKLIAKQLGFRMLMNVIPLEAELVKGSHGRIPEDKRDYPVIITQQKNKLNQSEIKPTQVFDVIWSHLFA
jgi:predicted AlkP superfamily pyrophosphatase or phosphodiesterase